jgi:hypothetical protein
VDKGEFLARVFPSSPCTRNRKLTLWQMAGGGAGRAQSQLTIPRAWATWEHSRQKLTLVLGSPLSTLCKACCSSTRNCGGHLSRLASTRSSSETIPRAWATWEHSRQKLTLVHFGLLQALADDRVLLDDPDHMLDAGKQTSHFFESVPDEYGRRRWRLKSLEH